MVKREDIHLGFIKKEPQTGSHKGIRYMLCKKTMELEGQTEEDKKTEDVINVCVWPEPNCYEQTSEELKTYRTFPLTEEGCDEAVIWINKKWGEIKV